MPKLQIQRMKTRDEHTRLYFSREKLAASPVGAEHGVETPSEFLNIVLGFTGVAFAEVHAYHLVISKTPVHDWTEVEPSILRLLSAFNVGVERVAGNETS